jgi:predicted permease
VPEGYTPQTDENMSIQYSMVAEDYFRAMGIRVLRGRAIGRQDAAGAPLVAVVNERFAEKYWPGLDPLGRRFRQGGRWFTVVGVAEQGKYENIDEPKRSLVYLSYDQDPWAEFTFHVRAAGDPMALSAALRAAAQSVSADLPLLDLRTMANHMQASMFVQRLGATMLAAFGLIALALSAIGIYGVMSYSVSQRTREIGVRVALGAARRDVVGMVVGRGMRLAGIGLVIGLAAALGAGQLLRTQLVGVGPRDPLTFTAIALLLGAVALGASWIPARRAARVDPMVALRYE